MFAADKSITALGSVSCKDWIAARRQEAERDPFSLVGTYQMWINGYLTGLNVNDLSDKDILRSVNSDTIAVWVDRHCKRNPKDGLYEAGTALFEALKKLETERPGETDKPSK